MSAYFNIGKKMASGIGQAINKVKTKVNTTKLGTAKSKLAKQIQKTKASSAKLKQTEFEIANPKFKGKDFTFAPKGKSESNKEAYKRIQKQNTETMGKMFKNIKNLKK